MNLLLLTLALVLAILLTLLPVRWAARAVGARRTGYGWCAAALIGASMLHGLGLAVPVAGSVVAFLLSALGFAGILGTGFIRGVGMAVLYVIFSFILIMLLALIFGAGAVGWGAL